MNSLSCALASCAERLSNDAERIELPLPALALVMDKLENVQDLCNAAQVCREWRGVACADTAWQVAFSRDLIDASPSELGEAKSWRKKYM